MSDYTKVLGNQCLNLTFPSVPCPFLPNLPLFLGEEYLHRKSIFLYLVSPCHTYPSGSMHKLLACSWNPIVNLTHQESLGLCVPQVERERTHLLHCTHSTVSSLLSARGSHECVNITWGSFYSRWVKFHLSCWKKNWEFSHSCNQNQHYNLFFHVPSLF